MEKTTGGLFPSRPQREGCYINVGPEKWQRVHIAVGADETKTLRKQSHWSKGVAMCEKGAKADLMKRELDNWMADFKQLMTEQQHEDGALKDLKNGLEASWKSFDKESYRR